MARRIGEAPPVTGDEVRDTWFWNNRWGYDRPEVDELLRRVAVELDAGRPAGPLIENAMFPMGNNGYDIDAVDWFLGQLLFPHDHMGSPGASADPWCDASDVAQLVRGVVSDLAQRYPRYKPTWGETQAWFAGQCEKGWRDFGQHPGTHLLWGPQTRGLGCYELRTVEQQTIATHDQTHDNVRMGGRYFIFQKPSRPKSLPPIIGEIAARSARDSTGHFAKPERRQKKPNVKEVRELVDEAGIPILYTSGDNFNGRACFCISFPDGRWLRFPVRGPRRANAIMIAVDQAGNKIARYRMTDKGLNLLWKTLLRQPLVEITVNPDRDLTDELAVAIAISARGLSRYFKAPQ